MKLPVLKPPRPCILFALLLVAEPIASSSPYAAFWTTPCILFASLVITWGAESAQFFVAQGFALAILAWMQTLPEFAVEAVLAWRQQTDLLLAGLSGALRLLTGLAWPLIYCTAAVVHRRREHQPLRRIALDTHHSVEVVTLAFPLAYAVFLWWKASIHLYDGMALTLMYSAYLLLLTKLPPEQKEGVDDLEKVPRYIVESPRPRRILLIAACFLTGGLLIYLTAEPFLGSLVALAVAVGIPSFTVIQWLAPIISEFPELLSTFYFARQEEKAPVALMNIASSNINQWTLLLAVLPVVYSLSRGSVSAIPLNREQQAELLLTIAQSVVAFFFLLNMSFAWWEALAMFLLFAAQFVLPAIWSQNSKFWISAAFFCWAAVSLAAILIKRQLPVAFRAFADTWRTHVRGKSA